MCFAARSSTTIIITETAETMSASDSEPAVCADHPAAPRSWVKRFGWLLLIWSASVAALGAAAFALRLLMRLIGMST
jgi:hypothetical protein